LTADRLGGPPAPKSIGVTPRFGVVSIRRQGVECENAGYLVGVSESVSAIRAMSDIGRESFNCNLAALALRA
jgi:hypothetical protein